MCRMRRFRFISILFVMFLAIGASRATPGLADGGEVRFSQVIGEYRVTVFTSPTPLKSGLSDISVLVQQATTGAIVRDAVIDLELRCESTKTTIRARAGARASTNKLLQSAKLKLPSAGVWRVFVTVQGKSTANATFNMTAYPASDLRSPVIVCLAIPLIAVGLFLLRERLVARQQS